MKNPTKPIEERKEAFRQAVYNVIGYSDELKEEFFDYWSEHGDEDLLMRYELKKNKPFNISNRMKRWHKNNINWNGNRNNLTKSNQSVPPPAGTINNGGFGNL